jgi:phosphate transport system substrate-binding protein
MAGSNSMLRLLRELATAYSARNPHVTFDLQGGGSEAGLELLRAGRVDMAASSWTPSEEELHREEETQERLGVTVIAQDGLALVVHPKNPVDELSAAQIRGIFSGNILDWRKVGGKVGDILVISREDGSGDRRTFETLIMDRQPVTLGAIVMPGSLDLVEYVASHPNAIGYASIAEITQEVKPLAVDGVEPTSQTIQDGSYHLWRVLEIITAEPPEGAVGDFLDFATSPAGQEIIQVRYSSIR